MNAQVHTRQEYFRSVGRKTLLIEKDLDRALVGFIRLMTFPDGTCECSTCGPTPEYLGKLK